MDVGVALAACFFPDPRGGLGVQGPSCERISGPGALRARRRGSAAPNLSPPEFFRGFQRPPEASRSLQGPPGASRV